MDAVEFLKEKDRMCKFYGGKCEGCPFEENEQGIHHVLCAFKVNMWCDEDYVRSVEEWSKEHPLLTNGVKFKNVFGFNPKDDSICSSFWDAPYITDTSWGKAWEL